MWNTMTVEQMEAQLLRQAVTIGRMREALMEIDKIATAHERGAIGKAQKLARKALGEPRAHWAEPPDHRAFQQLSVNPEEGK